MNNAGRLILAAPPAGVFVLGVGLEVVSIVAFAAQAVDGYPLTVFLILHSLGCIATGFGLLRWMPRVLRRKPLSGFTFFFTLTFFMPLLGALGLFAGLAVPILMPRKNTALPTMQDTLIPDLPTRPLIVSSQPIYSVMGLVGVIRHANDAAARVKAVMATRVLSDKLAVPILQVALRDPSDDVRLLAYALLDGKERNIYSSIKQLTARLAESVPSARGSIHKRLVVDHWELVYLGLASGEVLTHVLGKATGHVTEALASLPNDASLHFLKARIEGAKGDLEAASLTLDRAQELGLPDEKIRPYRAQLAFQGRKFDEVAEHLRVLPDESKRRLPLSAVVEYWGAR